MNNVDNQYFNLLEDILNNGVWKNTRSGKVKSVFGRTIRFNLKEGLPLLTTKKVYTKGVIYELLWFLSGNTNIKYLVDNNVNIWDDDAYRWFKSLINQFKYIERKDTYTDEDGKNHIEICGYYKLDYHYFDLEEDNISVSYCITYNKDYANEQPITTEELNNISKEQFIEYVKNSAWVHRYDQYNGRNVSDTCIYKFGDLGEIYGKQWRSYGVSYKDQIQNIIDTLKTNPDDRRMILSAWNPDVIDNIALPACHMFASFWTRELSIQEREDILMKKYDDAVLEEKMLKVIKPFQFDENGEYDEAVLWDCLHKLLDTENIPTRELSCSFTCRSQDVVLGTPFNWLSYAILTHLIAQCANMTVGDLVYNGLDCHIYENQIDAVNEQLTRDPNKYELPILKLNEKITHINDFTFEDIKIENYNSYPAIKAPLSVG